MYPPPSLKEWGQNSGVETVTNGTENNFVIHIIMTVQVKSTKIVSNRKKQSKNNLVNASCVPYA